MTDIQGLMIFVFCHEMSKNGFVNHVCTLKCTLFFVTKVSTKTNTRIFLHSAQVFILPNAPQGIVSKMSGHAEGSKAFSRYRDIDDDTLAEVIKAMQ